MHIQLKIFIEINKVIFYSSIIEDLEFDALINIFVWSNIICKNNNILCFYYKK